MSLIQRIYDSQHATDQIAKRLEGISTVGNMTPNGKYEAIKKFSDQGKHVLMVGDGLNDTAALTAAHASISPASALDASRTASDIVILGQTLSEIPEAIRVSQSARRRILENL
jgi:Cu2+-exporting ATPase